MLENWGQMTKAQDDSTTIDQAIAAAILAHEQDPESHMGAGESIENHRVNEIIDHKAGSVLADKWTMSEFEFTTTFDNLANFFHSGDVTTAWPGVFLNTNGVSTPHMSEIIADLESAGFIFNTAKDCLMQFGFWADGDTDSTYLVVFGTQTSDFTKKGMGLDIVGTTARFFTTNHAGTSFEYLSWPTFERGISYVIRMQNVSAEGVVKVYINGELLGTLVWPEQWDSNANWRTYLYDTTGFGNSVRVHSLYVMLSP